MALAKRMVDPRFFGPQLAQYMAKGAYAGGGAQLPREQSGQAGQVDPAVALSLWKMLGGGGSGADTLIPPIADSSFMDYGGSPVMNAELANADNFFWLN